MCLKIYYVYKRLKSNWKKLTCIPIIFRFQFRYILPFFTNECKRLMLPGSLKRTSSSKGSQKLLTQGWKVTNCVYWRLCKTIFGKWMNFCKYVSITYSLTKVHSFSKFCFAQSSVDTICDFPWTACACVWFSITSPIVRWWYSEILTNQVFFSFFP